MGGTGREMGRGKDRGVVPNHIAHVSGYFKCETPGLRQLTEWESQAGYLVGEDGG